MEIAAVVACANNGVIGLNNTIPWHLPADLKYFKQLTSGHTVIMGRKCFESIGKPLPNRNNIVLTRNGDWFSEGVFKAHSISDAFDLAVTFNEKNTYIIGGADIYKLAYPKLDKLYYTEVHADIEGDIFFKPEHWSDWELESEEFHPKDEKNKFDYTFKVFNRV